jgi:hypothetical protein
LSVSQRLLASLLGLGATVVACAFTIRPVHASRPVFWSLVGVGALIVLAGLVSGVRVASHRLHMDAGGKRRQLLALECRRLHASLNEFIESCRVRRRGRRWWSGSFSTEEWRTDTTARYAEDFREWALQVFDEAVACGAALSSSMPLVQSPAPSQLSAVCKLFADAAEALERA